MIGESLGPYHVTGLLGSGAMGEVYRARDSRLGREVALKVLRADLGDDARRIGRFRREAQVLASLNHPHIATLYGIEEAAGGLALVMELVEGSTIADLLRTNSLSTTEAIRFAAQLADALDCAHSRNVIHRDIKPANLKVGADCRLKVLDFGLAKLLSTSAGRGESGGGPEGEEVRTRAGMVLGTPAYMSPEQATGGTLDRRCDIWAFGVVLYEMLSGRRAFRGPSVREVIGALLRGHVDWTALSPQLAPELRELVERCLEPDLERRLGALGEARALLESLAVAPGASSVGSRASTAGRRGQLSLIVLPFDNLSPEPDSDYFSDGLTEEVIADLSKLPSLRVISRSTALRFKGTRPDLRSIAREIGVGFALVGSVRKLGASFRIVVQLIDIARDTPVWSEKYPGTLDDIFAIQSRVSEAIADSLRIELSSEDERRLRAQPRVSGFVHDVYLRSRRDMLSFQKERLDRARTELEHAIEVAGDNALLCRGLGMVLWQYVNAGITSDTSYLDRAETMAREVLRLEPGAAHGPALLACISIQRGDIRGWVIGMRQAVAIDEHDPDNLLWLGAGYAWAGQPERSLATLERLRAIDPLYDYLYWALGCREYFEGHFERAVEAYARGRKLSPDTVFWPLVIAQALASAGERSAAIEELRRSYPEPSAHPLATLGHALSHALEGDQAGSQRFLTEELRAGLWSDLQYTHCMAQVHALLGETELSIACLGRSIERGFLHHGFLSRDPLLGGLSGDPRYHALLARVLAEREALDAELRKPVAGSAEVPGSALAQDKGESSETSA